MLNVRTSRDQLDELQAIADEHGVEVAHVARRAIALGLRQADREIARAIDNAADGAPVS